MKTERDSEDMMKLALVQDLTNCLKSLDKLGANIAAAHVDAAIHDLLSKIASIHNKSKMD
ncbi:MAG: hypothetical protein RLZZ84_1988 [Pseudomonadota bacterium]|jgi:hypothetical protein